MNSFLLNRQLGSVSPQAFARAQNDRLLGSLQAADEVNFALTQDAAKGSTGGARPALTRSVAHAAGVSSISIDRFEGRYLLSGGADSSVGIWDLEAAYVAAGQPVTHLPLGYAAKTSTTASLGITHASFYPFDSLAFITSGFDHTVKLFSSETLKPSAKFDLGSSVYSHATSDVAAHLLVACATQHPAVRLVDLRSGASAHSLAGHSGSVLSVAWHPKDEHILASGATDGTVRLWDIRRSASSLGVLDMEDSVGVAGYDGRGTGARRRERGRAHAGAANGVVWADRAGRLLVSTGTDERMRVWDMRAGANTLANFGPALKNAQNTAVLPLPAPGHLNAAGSAVAFFPNPAEILAVDLHSGRLLQRLRVVGLSGSQATATGGGGGGSGGGGSGIRNLKSRTTSLAWRAHEIELYSAHTDGTIRCWRPWTWEDAAAEAEEREEAEGGQAEVESRKRKREELDQIVRDLTEKKVTFS